MKTSLLLAATCLFMANTYAQENAQPTLFVSPFKADLKAVVDWQPAMGEGLAEMFITELTKLNKFQVLESTAKEFLKEEIKEGQDGFVAPEEAVQKGGWAGADYMFHGTVTRFGSKTKGLGVGGFIPVPVIANVGIGQTKSDVRIDWRIVDATSRKVVAAGQAVGEEKGTSFDISGFTRHGGGSIGLQNSEFMGSALGKATVKALNSIMTDVASRTYPVAARTLNQQKKEASAKAAVQEAQDKLSQAGGKVISVREGSAVVLLGAQNGCKAGEVLEVFEVVEEKDDQGKVVFSEEKRAGEMLLESVQADRSKGKCLNGLAPQKGWIVKRKTSLAMK